jgi:hypothetical protein
VQFGPLGQMVFVVLTGEPVTVNVSVDPATVLPFAPTHHQFPTRSLG